MGARALFMIFTFAIMMGLMAYGLSHRKTESLPQQGIRIEMPEQVQQKTLEEIISDAEQNTMEEEKTAIKK